MLWVKMSSTMLAEYLCGVLLIASQDFVKSVGLSGLQAKIATDVIENTSCSDAFTASDVRNAASACAIGKIVFSEPNGTQTYPEYLSPSSPDYLNRTEIPWSNNCWQKASCIVSPRTTEEVSQALRIATFTGSKFSIRSGGHNYNVNYSSIGREGFLIDLVNLNQIQLSPDKSVLHLGPGVRCLDAYKALDGTGVSINGGRDPAPGTGGVFLGGGSGYFVSQYGMSANSLQEVEVVLANSTIVMANSSQDVDLFYALKGGGPNFGIVTRYSVATIPVNLLWYEARFYDSAQNLKLLDAVVKYQAAAENDDFANLVFQITPTITLVGFIYSKPVARPSIFEMFYSIPFNSSMTNSTIGTLYQLTKSYAVPVGPPVRHTGVSIAHLPSLQTYTESYQAYLNLSSQAARFGGSLNYGIQAFTSNALKRTYLNGGTPLNPTPVGQNWFIGALQWADAKDDATAHRVIQALGAAVDDAAKRNGVSLPFHFMNDANHLQDVFSGYGGDSRTRLRSISQAYDPRQFFQKQQNRGWLLSKSGVGAH